MRKLLGVLLLLLLGCSLASGQDGRSFTARSAHYLVTADTTQGEADELARRMESILAMANAVFHFDLATLAAPMRVRLFASEQAFGDYLRAATGQARRDFVFLAWSDPAQSQLLCFPRDERAFSSSLIHQGVVQLARQFVAAMPLWLREGVAAGLEAATWDAKAGRYLPRTNYVWLDGLKASISGTAGLIPLAELLTFTRSEAQANLDAFYPQAWGLVHFLLASPEKEHNRILWDAIAALRPSATAAENEAAVSRAFSWVPAERLASAFSAFILSLKTAAELAREGAERYARGDLDGAEQSLEASLELEPASATPLYYLGLVCYGRKDWAGAEARYQQALAAGAPAALVNYALGVNALAAGSYGPAARFLNLAKDADPAAYGEKVDVLLKRIAAQP